MSRVIRWRGGYTDLSAAAMTTYNNGLTTTYGLTAVGAPVRRTFGADGIFAAAAYQEAVLMLIAKGGRVWIEIVLLQAIDYTAFKAFTRDTFGLTNETVIEDTEA